MAAGAGICRAEMYGRPFIERGYLTMSGHSKWKNIMHKKEKTDAQRASVFTKIGKEISIAVREGGPDPVSNTRLRDLIQKAKANNVPNDNIDRVIKKAAGGDGAPVIVETMTDNRNRTAADIRHYFDKCGGNMGTTGCVSFMFADKGVIVVDGKSVADEDRFMEDVMECGAIDFTGDDGIFEVFTDPSELSGVRDALAAKGYVFLSAEPEKIPNTYVRLDDEEQRAKMSKLLGLLEDNDDVQNVWHNWEDDE